MTQISTGVVDIVNLQAALLAAAGEADLEYAQLNTMFHTDLLNTMFQNLFGRQPRPEGLEYWMTQISTGIVDIVNLQAALLAAAGEADLEYAHAHGYASGGYHSGGLRLVGETGPEFEYTGPSRISSNSDTVDMIASAVSKAIGGNSGGGNITVKVYVGNKEIKDITVETLRTNTEAQKQVQRIARVA
jgi:hypothetical protein